jgi:hypothetical protein
LEPWITPSIFENVDQSLGIVDEFTLTQKLPPDDAFGILNAHWSSFYTFGPFSLPGLIVEDLRIFRQLRRQGSIRSASRLVYI